MGKLCETHSADEPGAAQSPSDACAIEISEDVLLKLLSPGALTELRRTGLCEFDLPEEIFDIEAPMGMSGARRATLRLPKRAFVTTRWQSRRLARPTPGSRSKELGRSANGRSNWRTKALGVPSIMRPLPMSSFASAIPRATAERL